MKYFTADLNLGHEKIMGYCKRPFSKVIDMDIHIMGNLRVLSCGDILYILGDLTFDADIARGFFDCTDDLGVEVHYIWGNHDKKKVRKVIEKRSKVSSERECIRVDDRCIVLDHFAGRVWKESHFGSWQLYGHTHSNIEPKGKQYDVGVDGNEFAPVPYDAIAKIMETLPQNENFIKEGRRRLGK